MNKRIADEREVKSNPSRLARNKQKMKVVPVATVLRLRLPDGLVDDEVVERDLMDAHCEIIEIISITK